MEFVWCRRPCNIATTSIFKSPLSAHFHAAANNKAGEQVKPLFDGNPTPHFYEVAIG
jgi:hypothetical protein